MMDTLSSIVQNYIYEKWIQKEDLFENQIKDYSQKIKEEAIQNSNLKKEEKNFFLEHIKKHKDVIDLR
jgi:hypothetical protein